MDFETLGHSCVVGLQWGDEGKGKVVDLLTEHFDVVVRYGGGANAGHTVKVGDEKFALHLLPSGILRPEVLSVIGPGVVVDLGILGGEIDGLRGRGIDVGANLLLSKSAHLVMPYHKKQDRLAEARLGADRKIGTTAKGIGPCCADKMMRATALRVGDLLRPETFRARLREIVADRNRLFAALYDDDEALDGDAMADCWLGYAEKLAGHFTDTTRVLHEAIGDGRRILFEGAQGCLLDINHGTFPYVTSGVCTTGGVSAGAGVPPSLIDSYIGVIKAYTTRVGGGPFPTELGDATGDAIRQRGHEYGTTTGRPRRCGWFDAVAVRYAIGLSGITELAVMHIDTLGTLPDVRICTGYRYQGEDLRVFPTDGQVLSAAEPIYETLPGWRNEVSGVGTCEQLPGETRRYLDRLEDLLGVPITLVSVGAERQATLHRRPGVHAGFR